jgi:hypothetical protein
VDKGPLEDSNSDPITVAFIIDAFEQMTRKLNASRPARAHDRKLLQELEQAISTGLKYVFTTNLRSNGFWHYKTNQHTRIQVFGNLYQYTTDVISSIFRSCQRLHLFTAELDLVIEKLFEICLSYRGCLPKSENAGLPDLDATSRLILAARDMPHCKKKAAWAYGGLLKWWKEREVVEAGGANGWSGVLFLASLGNRRLSRIGPERTRQIEAIADEMRRDPSTSLPPEFAEYDEYIRKLLDFIQWSKFYHGSAD